MTYSDKGLTKRICIFTAVLILFVLFAVFLLPRLIVWVLPFIFAFIIAKIIDPIVLFLNKRLKIPKKLSSGITVVLVVALIIWVVAVAASRIVGEITSLVAQADVLSRQITEFFENWRDIILSYGNTGFVRFLDENVDLNQIGTEIYNYLTGYIWPMLEKLISVVKSQPNMLVFIIALFLGTFFISSDAENIRKAVRKMIPDAARKHVRGVKIGMSKALWGYVRAQLILMCITFTECTIGFLIIGGPTASYALLLGIVIAIIDAFPILGTGTVLIPWSIAMFISGNMRMGFALLIIYGVCLLVRQILEPRIVSGQIGIHPLVTLMSMYVGLKILGFLGMILGPVLALIIKSLCDSGFFKAVYELVIYGKTSVLSSEETN